MQTSVFFCHIGKTAGLSTKEMLKEHYGQDNCYDILDLYINRDKNTHGVFYGHGWYGLSETLPKPLYVFTMLRDPIDRIISLWKHYTRDIDNYPEIDRLLRMKFSEAIYDDEFIQFGNGITRTLGADCGSDYESMYSKVNAPREFGTQHQILMGKYLNVLDDDEKNEELLKRAKHVIDNIRFGFQENFEEGIKHVFEPLGIEPKQMVKINTAPLDQGGFNLSEKDLERLKLVNKYDMLLYEYAKKVYAERLK